MKRLVVCFDGTWNDADSARSETNVALIARSIRACQQDTGGIPQSVLYLRGVGSSGLQIQRILDGAIGTGVDENIRSGYMFLAQNYVAGDEIYLFGFSRGAFSARSLAGLVASCGLLKRQRLGDLRNAWYYYRNYEKRSPEDFVEKYSTDAHVDVEITMLGVWDTVGALGVPSHMFSAFNRREYGFHNTTASRITRHAYHAMAIDEARDEFVPTLWTGDAPEKESGRTVEQVWFAGSHGDVGGGYVDRSLADIPLVWMAEKAQACGLVIDWDMLPKELDIYAPHHDSRAGWSFKDRLTPTFRQICEKPFKVDYYETLYRPRDEGGFLRTINESLHQSVIDRYGRMALFSPNDDPTARMQQLYRPRNLGPLFPTPVLRRRPLVPNSVGTVQPIGLGAS
ncbi:DUF2235 domain-containing protein [Ensifer sp. OV372]|uniref:DUF2235 domain-containing protein n=1 Tax=Ensifer sp. OV372 TaxID=1855293 RepID=UPI0008EB3768|nr:DUF2235 domain-containing protein [Ensifer sp. OV372]SFH06569.1 Uncharacterized protein, PA2063/DUF2235 family [Ensifer sp. OV372]